jgi:hypothetical protein
MSELDKQIGKLAGFIIAEIAGEPNQSEGAVDCAIRIMRDNQAELAALRKVAEAAEAWANTDTHWEAAEKEGYLFDALEQYRELVSKDNK